MKDKEQIVNECLTKLIAACALEKMKRVVAQNWTKENFKEEDVLRFKLISSGMLR